MRPRVFPAEDAAAQRSRVGARPASMRPRVFPAEDSWNPARASSFPHGFNEAAGIPRGRRARRPRSLAKTPSFNEAAGIPRGRRGLSMIAGAPGAGLQ